MERKQRNTAALRKKLLQSIYLTDGLVAVTEIASSYEVSTVAVYKQLEKLEQDGWITSKKQGRAKHYSFVTLQMIDREYQLRGLNEDVILLKDFSDILTV